MTQPGTTHVSTDDGHGYTNPDEPLMYQLFLHLEDRAQGHLTLARHPGAVPSLRATRQGDGRYCLEERGRRGETRESIVSNMALAHDTVCRWAQGARSSTRT